MIEKLIFGWMKWILVNIHLPKISSCWWSRFQDENETTRHGQLEFPFIMQPPKAKGVGRAWGPIFGITVAVFGTTSNSIPWAKSGWHFCDRDWPVNRRVVNVTSPTKLSPDFKVALEFQVQARLVTRWNLDYEIVISLSRPDKCQKCPLSPYLPK